MQIRKCGPFAISIQIGHRLHVWGIGTAEWYCHRDSAIMRLRTYPQFKVHDGYGGYIQIDAKEQHYHFDTEEPYYYFDGTDDIVVHNGITHISGLYHSNAFRIRIPASVVDISDINLEFSVSPQNKFYSSRDGVLFSKDRKKLLLFPSAKEEIYYIPDSVQQIEEKSFYNSKLAQISIPDSVREIGYFAFQSCNSLKTVHVPGSVEKISFGSFAECDNLRNVVIHDGVRTIESMAFYGCKNLCSVTIPDSVEYIMGDAFNGCNGKLVHIHPGQSQCKLYRDGDHWEWEPGEPLPATEDLR